MTDSPEELRRVRDLLKKVDSGALSAAQLMAEAWHTLSMKSFRSIFATLFAILCFGFYLGTWWTHMASGRATLQQRSVPMQPAAKLSVVKCLSVQDISHLPEVWARLLGNNIDILRQDTQTAKFSRLFVLESGTLDHSYGVKWAIETWDGAPSFELMVSAAYLDQEIEGHESFSPLKIDRSKQRFRIEVPEVRSTAKIIALVALSGSVEIPEECTHLLKVNNE
jgi:hypothetical protein